MVCKVHKVCQYNTREVLNISLHKRYLVLSEYHLTDKMVKCYLGLLNRGTFWPGILCWKAVLNFSVSVVPCKQYPAKLDFYCDLNFGLFWESLLYTMKYIWVWQELSTPLCIFLRVWTSYRTVRGWIMWMLGFFFKSFWRKERFFVISTLIVNGGICLLMENKLYCYYPVSFQKSNWVPDNTTLLVSQIMLFIFPTYCKMTEIPGN